MIYYLDASAWVKYYLWEAGSEVLSALLGQSPQCACSTLGLVEVMATIIRRHRDRQADEDFTRQTINDVRRDFAGFIRIPVSDVVVAATRPLLQRHRLRGADCVHLASAEWLRQTIAEEEVTLVASDAALLRAASADAFPTLDPSTSKGS